MLFQGWQVARRSEHVHVEDGLGVTPELDEEVALLEVQVIQRRIGCLLRFNDKSNLDFHFDFSHQVK